MSDFNLELEETEETEETVTVSEAIEAAIAAIENSDLPLSAGYQGALNHLRAALQVCNY